MQNSFISSKCTPAFWACHITAMLLVLCCKLEAQNDYESVGVIYHDSYVSVELQFKLKECSSTRTSRFRYIITGQPRGTDLYLNWKMDYYNCDKGLTRQSNFVNIGNFSTASGTPLENMDWNFAGYRLYVPFFSVRTSNVPDNTPAHGIPFPVSTAPTSISGATQIDYGDYAILKQEGGALGENAKWRWYANECGRELQAEGEQLKVRPASTTVYFVRAEGPKGTTRCISVRVVVNTLSRPADSIDGKKTICKGASGTHLAVSGGKLGKGARWVWYKDSCGGQPIGFGDGVDISPAVTTHYFVRAEGDDNTTVARGIVVQVIEQGSSAPKSIRGVNDICEGNTVTLQVEGGRLVPGGQWRWYKEQIGSSFEIGEGATISDKPSSTTEYIVRGEDACSETSSQRIKVIVHPASVKADGIEVSKASVYRGQTVELSVAGGRLSGNAEWVWYKRKGKRLKEIEHGPGITRRVHRTTEYLVRSESECGKTLFTSRIVRCMSRYWLINAGVITNPFGTMAAGNDLQKARDNWKRSWETRTFGLTIGKIKENGGINWYLRGKYSFNSPTPEYNTMNTGLTDWDGGSIANYVFDGQVSQKRIAGTAGFFVDMFKPWILSIGLGYGERTVSWGIDSYASADNRYLGHHWAKSKENSCKGLEAELGLMFHLPVFNIMLGGNYIIPVSKQGQEQISNGYGDLYAGIGINF